MSVFIDTLTDHDGEHYEYGHCYADYDDGTETGCGMEYAYYPQFERLDRWHDAVGQVTTTLLFKPEDYERLEAAHLDCHIVGTYGPCRYVLDGHDTDHTPWHRCLTHEQVEVSPDAPCEGFDETTGQ